MSCFYLWFVIMESINQVITVTIGYKKRPKFQVSLEFESHMQFPILSFLVSGSLFSGVGLLVNKPTHRRGKIL
jgi:hypothetical protein